MHWNDTGNWSILKLSCRWLCKSGYRHMRPRLAVTAGCKSPLKTLKTFNLRHSEIHCCVCWDSRTLPKDSKPAAVWYSALMWADVRLVEILRHDFHVNTKRILEPNQPNELWIFGGHRQLMFLWFLWIFWGQGPCRQKASLSNWLTWPMLDSMDLQNCATRKKKRKKKQHKPIGSMVLLYMVTLCNMDPINIPAMLAYIPAPWILWERPKNCEKLLRKTPETTRHTSELVLRHISPTLGAPEQSAAMPQADLSTIKTPVKTDQLWKRKRWRLR